MTRSRSTRETKRDYGCTWKRPWVDCGSLFLFLTLLFFFFYAYYTAQNKKKTKKKEAAIYPLSWRLFLLPLALLLFLLLCVSSYLCRLHMVASLHLEGKDQKKWQVRGHDDIHGWGQCIKHPHGGEPYVTRCA